MHVLIFTEKKPSGEKYVLVLEQKTWRDAQEYCRRYHTDLAIVRNEEENQELHQFLHATLPSRNWVWTGLFSDDWRWSDKSGTSFRSWHSTEPNSNGKCGLLATPALKWWDRKCTMKYPFYCQKGTFSVYGKWRFFLRGGGGGRHRHWVIESHIFFSNSFFLYTHCARKVIPIARRAVRVDLTPHSPLNLSDAAVQEALLQQVCLLFVSW